jgi:coenzyme F420-reducing hydrogenase delta subunit
LGSIGGITATDELEAFRLGAISILLVGGARAELQKGFGGKKARTRARKAEAAKSAVLMGYSRVRYRF